MPRTTDAPVASSDSTDSHGLTIRSLGSPADLQRTQRALPSCDSGAAASILPTLSLTDSNAGKESKATEGGNFFSNLIDKVEKNVEEVEHQAVLLGEGLVSGAILNPINAVTQLSNNLLGTHLEHIEFANQKEVDASIAGKIGEIAGTAADFIALSVVTGGAADVALGAGAVGDAVGLAAAGAIQGGIFTPTSANDTGGSFIVDRIEGAGLGAATGLIGGAGGKVAGALEHAAGGALDATAAKVASVAINTVVNGGVGAVAGTMSVEVDSLVKHQRLATVEEVKEAATRAAIEGAGIGGASAGLAVIRGGAANTEVAPHEVPTTAPPETTVTPHEVPATVMPETAVTPHEVPASVMPETAVTPREVPATVPPGTQVTPESATIERPANSGSTETVTDQPHSKDGAAATGQDAVTPTESVNQPAPLTPEEARFMEMYGVRNEAELYARLIPTDPLPEVRGRTPEGQLNELTAEQREAYAKQAQQLTGFADAAHSNDFVQGFKELQAKWEPTNAQVEPLVKQYAQVAHDLQPLELELSLGKSQIKDQINWSLRAELDSNSSNEHFRQFLVDHESELTYIPELAQTIKTIDQVTALRTEFDTVHESLDQVSQARKADLQTYLDQFTEKNGLPRAELTVGTMPGEGGSFNFGSLSVDDMALVGDQPRLQQILFHELTHNAQETLIVRSVADSIPGFDNMTPDQQVDILARQTIEKMQPNVKDIGWWKAEQPQAIKALRSMAELKGEQQPSDEQLVNQLVSNQAKPIRSYVEQVIKLRNGETLSESQHTSADKLAESFAHNEAPSDKAAVSGEMLSIAQESLDKLSSADGRQEALKMIDELVRQDKNSPLFQLLRHDYALPTWGREFFPIDPNSPISKGYQLYPWQEDFLSMATTMRAVHGREWAWPYQAEVLRRDLVTLLQKNIDNIEADQVKTIRTYQDQLHEQEAWHAGELVLAQTKSNSGS